MTVFATKVSEVLDNKGLKRAALVNELDIPEATVRSWFNRGSMPSADIAFKVAKFLGVSVEYLLTGREVPEPSAPAPSGLERKVSMLSAAQKKAVEAVIDSFLDGATGETTA